MSVPAALAAWEPQLRIFPREIGLVLAPMAQRIAALLGSFSGTHQEGKLEPDGFGGLEKRGEYHRLIASDWLLADEFPEEFTRRSVMGEHLFWKVAHRELKESRGTWVLFDAGPEQLGSPRLAHIGALFALRARSQAAGALFGWGILQKPEMEVLSANQEGEIRQLLAARGSASASQENLETWARRARENGVTDVWVVGSKRLSRFLHFVPWHALLVSDVLRPGVQRLSLECLPLGKHIRNIELQLPAATACAQILRDPFNSAVAQAVTAVHEFSSRHLLFSASGHMLYTLTAPDTVMGLPIPNSPKAAGAPGKAKFYRSSKHWPVIAVGKIKGSLALISHAPGNFALQLDFVGRQPSTAQGEFVYRWNQGTLFDDFGYLRCCATLVGPDGTTYVLDDRGSLIRLSQGKTERRASVHLTRVLAFMQTVRGACFVAYDPRTGTQEAQLRVFMSDQTGPLRSFPTAMRGEPERAFFGCGSLQENSVFGLLAVGYGDGRLQRWEIFADQNRIKIRPEMLSGSKVHGVIRAPNYEETLIVVREDQRTLALAGAHGERKLLESPTPIVHVTGCQRFPLIVYSTADGQIFVHSLRHNKTVLHYVSKPLKPEGGAA